MYKVYISIHLKYIGGGGGGLGHPDPVYVLDTAYQYKIN